MVAWLHLIDFNNCLDGMVIITQYTNIWLVVGNIGMPVAFAFHYLLAIFLYI